MIYWREMRNMSVSYRVNSLLLLSEKTVSSTFLDQLDDLTALDRADERYNCRISHTAAAYGNPPHGRFVTTKKVPLTK